MRVEASLVAVVLTLGLPTPARAVERPTINRHTGLLEPPVSDLCRASERGDRAELARVATRLGAARLSRLLGDPDRKIVMAALDAAPWIDASALLLEPALPRLSSSDPALRARAVTATAALFTQNGPDRFGEYEVATETIVAACRSLAALSVDEGERLGTRLSAVQGLLDAGLACQGYLKVDLLSVSREPEIRRAAVLAAPEVMAGRANGPLVTALKDTDPRVRVAAVARLCRLPGPRPAALPPLHSLALADDVPVEDVVELLPCLAASTDPADQRALTQLQASGRGVIRDAIQRLREAK